MLNFKNISRIFILSEVILFILAYINTDLANLSYFLLPFFIYLFFLVYGSIFISQNFYFKSVQKLKNPKAVLLTFDDGPDPEITPQILNLLNVYDRKAIFFLIGEKAEKYPELVKSICKKGHTIGNHSYSHEKWFDMLSSSKMTKELDKTTKILANICGKPILFFRPPFGVTNLNLKQAIIKSNLKSIGWTYKSLDTGTKSVEQLSLRINKKIRGGEILLFHDNRQKSLEVLKLTLPFLCNFKQGDIDYDAFD